MSSYVIFTWHTKYFSYMHSFKSIVDNNIKIKETKLTVFILFSIKGWDKLVSLNEYSFYIYSLYIYISINYVFLRSYTRRIFWGNFKQIQTQKIYFHLPITLSDKNNILLNKCWHISCWRLKKTLCWEYNPKQHRLEYTVALQRWSTVLLRQSNPVVICTINRSLWPVLFLSESHFQAASRKRCFSAGIHQLGRNFSCFFISN